jgi:Proto-chlorophyllide reductase 57 kD subunit
VKFLCVPCDSPMKLQTVGPPERGSLSVVYACPECGYEIAMLTNAYETQIVQSLGVRIGPDRLRAEGASASRAEASAETSTSDSRCPFSAMVPAPEAPRAIDPAQAGDLFDSAQGKPLPIRWTAAAEARLANIPEFVRPMARTGIERFARERGVSEVDENVLDAAREFFGM